jgi:hypothetical protein
VVDGVCVKWTMLGVVIGVSTLGENGARDATTSVRRTYSHTLINVCHPISMAAIGISGMVGVNVWMSDEHHH